MSELLQKSQKAPDFSVLNQNDELLSLSAYQGEKNVVLYFYPKDDTPGCTIEARDFTALAAEFAALDTVILPAVLLPINKFPAVTRLSSALVKPKVRDVTVAFPTSLPPTLTKTPLLRF